MSQIETELLIIGAGAAGLASAYYAKNKIDYIVIEKGESAGTSWLNMPENIYLLSPWYVNRLPGSKLDKFKIFKQHGCREFGKYLNEYVDQHGLNVQFNKEVEKVTESSFGYSILLKDETQISCKYLINATGYFHNPIVPKNNDLKGIPFIHVQQFQSAEKLSKRFDYQYNNVLVVGSRISGGQTATELSKHGFQVTVSARTPVTFAQEPWLQKLVYLPYYVYEKLLSKVKPKFLEDTSPPMEAGETKKLVEQRKIKLQPAIKSCEGHKVEFTNGSSDNFDLIIYCTGFGYVDEHLKALSSTSENNTGAQTLFFMGKDLEYTARSRYLRGIREDAKKVINMILKLKS
mgnify:FL=1